jgi:hypothetical protein
VVHGTISTQNFGCDANHCFEVNENVGSIIFNNAQATPIGQNPKSSPHFVVPQPYTLRLAKETRLKIKTNCKPTLTKTGSNLPTLVQTYPTK